MTEKEKIQTFIKELNEKIQKEMPRVEQEIKVYEQNLAKGTLIRNPEAAPQFNV